MKTAAVLAGFATWALLAAAASAADPASPDLKLVLENHRFTPPTLTIPAGQRVKVEVVNRDATGDEFENEALGVEKEIGPHGRATIAIGPLKPGTYRFVGELHPDTAVLEVRAEAPK
jgi:hypothetical protein